MKLFTFQHHDSSRIAAVVDDLDYVDLNQTDPALPCCMKQLLALGDQGFQTAQKAAQKAIDQGEKRSLQDVTILTPVIQPEKIICVGLNYADHAKETGAEIPNEPVIFNKFPTTLIAHQQPILLPSQSDSVDYEAELVVVIGKQGSQIAQENAMQHVAGYCCGHDVSARDWQKNKPAKQWLLGKTFDTFAPLGPYMVTADEIGDPHNLRIQFRLNGQTMQDSSTSQFIFQIDTLISYLSQVCTLKPGDLIFTGTPPGVGAARVPPIFLKAGDQCEVEIEKIGILNNPVRNR